MWQVQSGNDLEGQWKIPNSAASRLVGRLEGWKDALRLDWPQYVVTTLEISGRSSRRLNNALQRHDYERWCLFGAVFGECLSIFDTQDGLCTFSRYRDSDRTDLSNGVSKYEMSLC